jgi:GAF domain-containing protein
VLGALCIISKAPRQWQPDELELLSELAALAVTEIEYRLRTRSLRELEVLSGALAEPLAQLGEAVRSMVVVADRADDPLVGRLRQQPRSDSDRSKRQPVIWPVR